MSSEGGGVSADQPARRGRLFVVSAPSGTGKTSLVERLVRRVPDLVESCSYTSRPARDGERDGVDYHFISRQRFEEMVGRGAFLEWADVFGKLYGTAKADTEAQLARRCDVVLVIDVQGARQLRANGVEATSIFVLPLSPDVLESRLRGRSQDSEVQIRRRLAVARDEVLAVYRVRLSRCQRRIRFGGGASEGDCTRLPGGDAGCGDAGRRHRVPVWSSSQW